MKKLIYSQEDLDLILSTETQEKDEKIERLNNVIKKAIEYIEEIMPSLRLSNQMYSYIKKHLLEILKGDSNE